MLTLKEEYGELTKKFIREANIILNKKDVTTNQINLYNTCLNIFKEIDNSIPTCDKNIDEIVNTISNMWNTGILSPLTLEDDEFINTNDVIYNSRFPNIIKKGNDIIHKNPIKLYINKIYDYDKLIELDLPHRYIINYNKIYLSKGGVINGSYIDDFIIKSNIVDIHHFNPHIDIDMHVCVVYFNNNEYIYIDNRNNSFNYLKYIYNINIKHDSKFNKILDIRNCKKIKV